LSNFFKIILYLRQDGSKNGRKTKMKENDKKQNQQKDWL